MTTDKIILLWLSELQQRVGDREAVQEAGMNLQEGLFQKSQIHVGRNLIEKLATIFSCGIVFTKFCIHAITQTVNIITQNIFVYLTVFFSFNWRKCQTFVDPILLPEEVKFDFACDFIQLDDYTNVPIRNTQSKQHTIELSVVITWGVKCVCACELCVIENYAARPSSLLRKSRVVSV